MLIQQRPLHKATFPGLWANACCSHPLVGEDKDMIGAMRRRIRDELGLALPEHGAEGGGRGAYGGAVESGLPPSFPSWTPVGRLLYAARCPVNRGWGEHELDHVYALEVDNIDDVGRLEPRGEEVAAVRWVDPVELRAAVRERPTDYAPWFKAALEHLILPVWTELYQYRHRQHQPRDTGHRWPTIAETRIIRCGELS